MYLINALLHLLRMQIVSSSAAVPAVEHDKANVIAGIHTNIRRITEAEETTTVDSSQPQEWYIHLFLAIVFGLVLSFVGSAVGYYLFLEARLMRRYSREGEIVRAEVVESKLVRGAGRRGEVDTADDEFAMYAVVVHYYYDIAADYTVKIRKCLKVNEGDLITSIPDSSPPTDTDDESSKQIAERRASYIPPAIITDGLSNDSDPQQQANTSIRDFENACIDLFVLAGDPRSGYPKAHVQRASSLRRIARTACFVGTFFCTAGLLFGYSAHLIILEESEGSSVRIAITIGCALVTILALQLLLVQQCLWDRFQLMLNEDYLENGDFLSIPRDNSTISLTSGLGSVSWNTSFSTTGSDLLVPVYRNSQSFGAAEPDLSETAADTFQEPDVASSNSSFQFFP